MITAKDLASAMPGAEPFFDRLQGLYGRFSETRCKCEQPGVCCMFLPEITVLEALQWVKLIMSMSDSELDEILRKFVGFYLTNPARLTGCPFLENGACSIYQYRTFGCRSYGLWSQTLGKTRTEESRKGKKALGRLWKRFGVELPADIIEFEIDYCDKVQIQSGKSVGDTAIMELLKQVYDIGKHLADLQTRFEEEYHSDFSFLLTSLALGMRKTLLLKIMVIREIAQKGTDIHLQEIFESLSHDALRLTNRP